MAQRGEAAPLAHTAAQTFPQAVCSGTVCVYATSGSTAVGSYAGVRSRQANHGGRRAEERVAEECCPGSVSAWTYHNSFIQPMNEYKFCFYIYFFISARLIIPIVNGKYIFSRYYFSKNSIVKFLALCDTG